ncbi:MAG TPA: expansin EXLX1 family cellulose-binding protein [Polyangiaceae bacterium]|nr:expansin EXLX1 family cellulose-binding protein [Polyangiaceae bacterium]
MRTRSWFVHGARLVVPAVVVSAYGCAAGDLQPGTEAEAGSGGSSAQASGGTSAAAGSSSAARGGSAGATSNGGSSGTTGGLGATGGASTGGASTGGGAGMATGGGAGSASGMGGSGAGAGGAAGMSAGGASGTAGAGAESGAGGTVVDPCAMVTCGEGQTCMNGTCMCMTGMLCGTTCVDTQADQANCGACGTACAADGSCVDGKCVNPMCTADTMVRNGHITHYTLATSMVACHYPTSSLPQYYGAMNEYDWNTAGVCGSCVEITNGGNKLVVQIVDQCPYKGNEQWCFQGSHHIDLNDAANSAINGNSNPAVTWKYVSCSSITGNVKYYFDSASQQYYLAVTPMNHKNPLAKVEVKKAGAYTTLTRNNSNMYELKDGAGTGALSFRLTDIYNHVITDTVTMNPGQTVEGMKQFAACP